MILSRTNPKQLNRSDLGTRMDKKSAQFHYFN